jgi:hypothetical protein
MSRRNSTSFAEVLTSGKREVGLAALGVIREINNVREYVRYDACLYMNYQLTKEDGWAPKGNGDIVPVDEKDMPWLPAFTFAGTVDVPEKHFIHCFVNQLTGEVYVDVNYYFSVEVRMLFVASCAPAHIDVHRSRWNWKDSRSIVSDCRFTSRHRISRLCLLASTT